MLGRVVSSGGACPRRGSVHGCHSCPSTPQLPQIYQMLSKRIKNNGFRAVEISTVVKPQAFQHVDLRMCSWRPIAPSASKSLRRIFGGVHDLFLQKWAVPDQGRQFRSSTRHALIPSKGNTGRPAPTARLKARKAEGSQHPKARFKPGEAKISLHPRARLATGEAKGVCIPGRGMRLGKRRGHRANQ